MFFLDLVCNMNFVKHILRPLFDDSNMWVFRVEYIVTYYTYRAIQRLKNYCDNNIDLCIDLGWFTETLSSAKNLFQSKFRNCMMHYGIENQGVISIENIEKPFYGIVETCYNGMDYYSFLGTLRRLSNEMIDLLEKRFNIEKLHYDAYKGSCNDNVFLNKRRGVINRAKTPRVCNVFATTFRVTP